MNLELLPYKGYTKIIFKCYLNFIFSPNRPIDRLGSNSCNILVFVCTLNCFEKL